MWFEYKLWHPRKALPGSKPQPKTKTFAPRRHGVTEKKKNKWSYRPLDSGYIQNRAWIFQLFSVTPCLRGAKVLSLVVASNPATPSADAIAYTQTTCSTGLYLHHNHQRQIPRTNPARPPGKRLPPLNPTSLATKSEQRRSHPQRRPRHRK